jgi:hypothetical protein
MPSAILQYGPFRRVEAGPDGRTLYLYGRAGATMDQVKIWVEEIWADEGRHIILGDIGTEQFRMMLQLPE